MINIDDDPKRDSQAVNQKPRGTFCISWARWEFHSTKTLMNIP